MPDPTTPNLHLNVPPAHELNWDLSVNPNWYTIDAFAGAVVLLSPTTTQAVTQPGGTYTDFNRPRVAGSPASLYYQNGSGVGWGALTASGSGIFTLDKTAQGDGAARLTADTINAQTGFQVAGAAPLNHILVGNGTSYVDSSVLPAGLIHYQTVQQGGVSYNQRSRLNFINGSFALADDSGNDSTDVDLASTAVTPGSYTAASITVDSKGRITAASSNAFGNIPGNLHDVTGSRAAGGVYQNAYQNMIMVVGKFSTTGSQAFQMNAYIGPTGSLGVPIWGNQAGASTNGFPMGFCFPVPASWFYQITTGGTGGSMSVVSWYEMEVSQ